MQVHNEEDFGLLWNEHFEIHGKKLFVLKVGVTRSLQ